MKYDKMPLAEFVQSQPMQGSSPCLSATKKNELFHAPYLSCRQVHDHLRENHSDFPAVSDKTVFNFVMHVREKYGIKKGYEETVRPFEKLPETPPGKSMQVDFGEYWMRRDDTRRVKVYFFVSVASRSRRKFLLQQDTIHLSFCDICSSAGLQEQPTACLTVRPSDTDEAFKEEAPYLAIYR